MTFAPEVLTHCIVDRVIFSNYVSERRPERLLRTISIFSDELDDKVAALSDIITKRDVEALRCLTHSMLGSAAMLGAQRMVHISTMLHQASHEAQAINWASVDELHMIAKETASVFKNFGTMRQIEDYLDQETSSAEPA